MEEAELTSLYERYGYLVHRRCLALLRAREDADDALQEVFLRVQRYHASHQGGSPLSWLYSITNRVCFDLMDRCRRDAPPAAPGERADHDGEARGPTTGEPSDADRRAYVGAVIRTFDEKTRQIAVLHLLEGLTQDEVAAETGYSRKTVGKKLKDFEERFRALWTGGDG